MTRILGWLAVLLLLMLLTPNPANAQQLELSLGVTQYGARNGYWWQDDYEHYAYHNHLRGLSTMASIRWPKWRLSLVNMPRAWNQAMWGQYELVDELKGNYPRCDSGKKNICNYGHGSGRVWGISLGRIFTLNRYFEAEAGEFLYRATWHEDGIGPFGPWVGDKNGHNGASASGSGDSAENHLTYFLGIGAHYKYMFAQFRYYANVRDGAGLMGQMAKQVMVGVSIPLNVEVK